MTMIIFRRTTALVLSASLGLGAACLFLVGCNIAAPVFYFIHGPEKTPKMYDLDPKRTTVVFVDDRSNRVPRRASRLIMAEEAEKVLLSEKAVKDLVSTQSAMAAVGRDAKGQPTPISEIGRAVKAEVVIYATIDEFHLTTDGQTFAPGATFRVRVIDAVHDKRLWPDRPEGQVVKVSLRVQAGELPTSTAGRYAAEDELARQAGTELAWLFVAHETPSVVKPPE
jgi:hypothetical protein